ncbi:MAG: Monogalactosyldiacylglycerol synthase [Bryobacterales bacterium]|nr:Monogalactosyldiacylglycerol synthase [Bryobacterales bacterium]
MTNIDFLYFDAGGGHRAAATALKAVIDQQKRPWEIRLVNLQDVLEPLDVFRKVTGLPLQDIYNQMLARGWTLGSAQGLQLMHVVIRLYHRQAVQLLEKHWAATQPDLVVSLVPNFNRPLRESLKNALPAVPYVTILTDMADYPPHFWMEKQEQFLICGSDKAVKQALALGHTEERIFRASGMILRPGFYEPVTVDRLAERKKLGLDPERPTGLVLFGGQGSKVMLEIAERLEDTQLILICGKNTGLADRLKQLPAQAPRYVEGFTSEIPHYMSLADFFIGKPGPGSISEAVAMGLPVIVERNLWTLPQERYNADWVRERNAGLVVPNFRGIRGAVDGLLRDLPRYKASVARIHNRAVFEIPDMLAKILE